MNIFLCIYIFIYLLPQFTQIYLYIVLYNYILNYPNLPCKCTWGVWSHQTVQRIVSQHGVNFSNFEAGSAGSGERAAVWRKTMVMRKATWWWSKIWWWCVLYPTDFRDFTIYVSWKTAMLPFEIALVAAEIVMMSRKRQWL